MRLCALVAALLIYTAPAIAGVRPVTIKMDLGGWMPTYMMRAERWASEGRRVIIDGDCRSACTFYLWTKYHLDVCVTPNARLMFHKPFWRTGPGRHDVEATAARVEWSNRQWTKVVSEFPANIAKLVRDPPNPSEIKDARIYTTLTSKMLAGVVKRCTSKLGK